MGHGLGRLAEVRRRAVGMDSDEVVHQAMRDIAAGTGVTVLSAPAPLPVSVRSAFRIGIATWDLAELTLFEWIVQAVENGVSPFERVEVFDLKQIHGLDVLQLFLPGVGRPPAPPFAGVWRDGQIVQLCWFFEARQLIYDSFEIRIDPWTLRGY